MTFKKNVISAFFIIFLGVFGLVGNSLSDSVGFQDAGFTYSFHLYLDQQSKLIKDRDFSFPFDLIAKEYDKPESGTPVYKGEILSVRGAVLADFEFYPKTGKVTVEAPYFANAKTANFYNPDNVKLLEIDLAPGGPVCNEDGICNSDTGENNQNCPNDCKVAPTTTITPKPTPPTLLSRIFSLTNLLGLLIVVALVFLFRWLKNKKQNVALPPQI